jgi:cobalamin biosynthesis protein CbiD
MVEPFLTDETVKTEAAMATIKIVGAIMQTHPSEAKAAMKKLLAVLQDEDLHKQAEEIIHKIEEFEADMRNANR